MGVLCLHSSVWAGAATWTNVNSGTLGTVGITVSYTSSGETLGTDDFSGTNHAYQPLTASQTAIATNSDQDVTFTFASPVSNLLLYGLYWRGTGCGGSGIYTFNHAPTIKSGFGTAAISGNNLTIGSSSWANSNGILSFAGPLTSLTINPDCTGASGNGYYTFATDDTLPPPAMSAPILNLNQPAVIYSEEIDVTK